MARKRQKKGVKGNAANYITRNKALKKLQLSLKDFRQICILKGIYPREPKSKFEGRSKTYYLTKDIQFLAHESIIDQMREMKVFKRKLKKALRKKQETKAKHLRDKKPKYTVDHIVKERYPTFMDAIRDMDDALCMVHLFANFPATKLLEKKRVAECARLSSEFQQLVMRTRKLRKVFVSIKGIYYQAEVCGQPVVWVVPHAFTQTVPTDVDYRVMVTFLQFYTTQLKFINFKLYNDVGYAYPPKLQESLNEGGLGLAAVQMEKLAGSKAGAAGAQEELTGGEQTAQLAPDIAAAAAEAEDDEEGADSDEEITLEEEASRTAEGREDGEQDDEEEEIEAGVPTLFSSLRVFMSREVNVEVLLFVIRACGGKQSSVGWEGPSSPFDATDPDITHMIVDRPTQKKRLLSREYVQPQWVFDSVNTGVLLPCVEYAVGAKLPPHLSPFADNDKLGYTPRRARELQAYAEGKSLDQIEWSDEEGTEEADDDGDSEEGEAEDEDEEEEEEEEEEDDDDEEEEEDEEEEDEEEESSSKKRKAKGSTPEDDDAGELAKMMMTKKNYRLYQRMQHSNNKKSSESEVLRQKRRKLEKA